MRDNRSQLFMPRSVLNMSFRQRTTNKVNRESRPFPLDTFFTAGSILVWNSKSDNFTVHGKSLKGARTALPPLCDGVVFPCALN